VSTSSEAYEAIKPAINELQQTFLDAIRRMGPVTHHDLIARYPEYSESTIRTRVSELVKLGLVRATGTTTTLSGRRATLWSVA